jgi:glycerol-3-phosphate dehydrogenase
VNGERYDLVVIGAGINGAGIARDAARRGLAVLLADGHDIANATTSRSTRLIHGGLRYLEHYELRLVREALKEREVQLRAAPHLVEPLTFFIPVYEDFRRGRMMVRLGLVAYDVLSADRSLSLHEMLDSDEALEREPGVDPEGLTGAAVYADAQAEYPERLAVEAAVDAVASGAQLRTYTEVTRVSTRQSEDGRAVVESVALHDRLTGERWTVEAAVVVNASGPYVDRVLDLVDGVDFAQRMGGTKGSHIVVGRFAGAPEHALYVEAEDERPFFVIPWLDRYLIGTTDRDSDGDLDEVAATDEEIDYLIESTNRVIPEAELRREDVLYSYAGVRPLPHEPDADPGEVTRSHIVERHDEVGGLISVIGGKITTWRALAEETVDVVFELLGGEDPGCSTEEAPLPGGRTDDWDAFAERIGRDSQFEPGLTERLLTVYGTRTWEILELCDEEPALGERCGGTDLLGAEVIFGFTAEHARTIADVLLRRSMVGYGPDLARDAATPAARLAAQRFGWDEQRVEEESSRFRAELERFRPEHDRSPT